MRLRTYLGILLGALLLIGAALLTQLNIELLRHPFQLTGDLAVPFWALLVGVFLLAFLPTATVALVESVRRDLAVRRERRESREAESVERSLRRAVDLAADGQHQRSAEELEVVLASRPESFEALSRYGEALRELGRLDEATDAHQQASVQFPQSVSLLYELAEDYAAKGEAEVAREVRNRILRDFPGMGLRLLRRRRNAALDAHDWREATALQERVEALAAQGPESEAERSVARGLAYQSGVTALEEDRYEDGIAIFRGLLVAEPRFIPAAIMLGEAELLSEREDEALEVWLEGFRRTGSPVFLQRVEDHFIERAEPARALETLWSLVGEADNDLLPRFFLGRLYYRLEMHGEALKVLEGLRERIGSSPTFHFLLARTHEIRGETAQALKEYRLCAQQAQIPTSEYLCRVCHRKYPDWRDRCEACGSWNSVELDFEEESLTPADLGLVEAPVWGGYEEPPEPES